MQYLNYLQKVTVVLVILLFSIAMSNDRVGDYVYMQMSQMWYHLRQQPATWTDARVRCQLEGGVLTSPITDEMRSDMIQLMQSAGKSMVFIGVHGLDSMGDFVTIDGTRFSNLGLNWEDGEPNNVNGTELCMAMSATSEVSDVSCSITLPFFCRKDRVEVNACSSTDSEYKLDPRTKSCYRFHRQAQTWHRASLACRATGGHLVIIDSQEEANVVKELFAKNHANVIKRATNPNYILVGFWKWNDLDEGWLTVNGKPLEDSDYYTWKKGEPNNLRGVERCGAFWRGGGYADVPCRLKQYPFLCEITEPEDNNGWIRLREETNRWLSR